MLPRSPEKIHVAKTYEGRQRQWRIAQMFARRPGADINQPWYRALMEAIKQDKKIDTTFRGT